MCTLNIQVQVDIHANNKELKNVLNAEKLFFFHSSDSLYFQPFNETLFSE